MNKQKNLEGKNADENTLIVTEVVTIEDGKHIGIISNMVRETRKEFDYIDVYVEIQDVVMPKTKEHPGLKTGFPAKVSERSSFGKFLLSAGLTFGAGDTLIFDDLKTELVGRKIEFQTMIEGDFSNIINKTIKFV